MARINIEDSIFKDARFLKLVTRFKDLDTALGTLIRAWMLAQKWYTTPERMIPLEDWKKQGIDQAVLDVGLAVLVDGKVRLAGADEQFGWMTQRREAGKKGGLKSQEIQHKHRSSKTSKLNPLSPSPSPSPSLAPSLAPTPKKEQNKDVRGGRSPSEPPNPPAHPGYLPIETILAERKVSGSAQARWAEAYPDDEWVCQAVRKALAWEAADPRRRKRNFSSFMTNWLSRDWDRRSIPAPQNRAEVRSRANHEAVEEVKRMYRDQDKNNEL